VREKVLQLLVDPVARTPLTLEDARREAGEVIEGRLVAATGQTYRIRDGIPRFSATKDPGQAQTQAAFSFKWRKRDAHGSPGMRAALHRWLIGRYGFASAEEMRNHFAYRHRTLDVGCGAGLATAAWLTSDWTSGDAEWVGVDVSDAIDIAREQLGGFPGTSFVQADVLTPPFPDGTFDAVMAEGVLHHTPSTEEAFRAAARLVERGGELMVYVYRRKAPVREFADDYVRSRLAALSPEEAWDTLRPLTRLAQALAELGVEVDVPEDEPLLEIPSGRHDVQRLLYWHFAKLYWNPALEFEENVHVNFDWYAPQYAHRHTEEELRRWYDEADFEVVHFDAGESGFTARGVKR
jgi:SAM-dependent methyltransferase